MYLPREKNAMRKKLDIHDTRDLRICISAMFRVVSVDQKDANDSLSCCYLLNKFENFHIKGANNTFIVSK